MAQDEKSKLIFREDFMDNIPFDCFTAASNGDISYFTKYIVGTSDNFSFVNKSGWTPIMYACARGHALLVSYLIMCGVKTSSTSESKVTPLMLAVASGDLPTVECVFNAGDMEARDYRMWTALFYAVYFLHEKCVEFLLSKGANVNIVDFQNETPLLIAVKSGSESMVKLILQSAINLEVISFKNETAVMLAKESNNDIIRECVLKRREFLKTVQEQGLPTDGEITRKKFFNLNKENICKFTPSPARKSPKSRSFLGVKISKSLSYSPNAKQGKFASESTSTIQVGSDRGRVPLWKMCIAMSPLPTNCEYDVEALLITLGLEKYWPIFRDEEVDFETLLTFSEDNLKEIGITRFGPRKKIISAIQQLRIYNNL